MAFGLSATGFKLKRLEDLITEFEDQFRTEFGDINLGNDSAAGKIVSILAKLEADIWELKNEIYDSQYPNAAQGVGLDNVSDLVGIRRLSATKSLVVVSVFGSEGTVLPLGRLIEVTQTGNQFISLAEVTIRLIQSVRLELSVGTVVDSTDYTITINGTAYTHDSGAGATAINIMAGLETLVTGGSEPVVFTDNLDGTAIIDAVNITTAFSGLVTANLSIDAQASGMFCESINFGPIVALANTLDKIVTPVSGWDAVSNTLDADLGRNEETDVELRFRRQESLQIAGAGTVESIRAALLQVTGVTGVIVIENRLFIVDGVGRPPKSYECVISNGADQDLGDEIWRTKPAGIETFGTESVVVVDSQGGNQTVKFSRATEIFLWIRTTITKNLEEVFPSDGVTQITDNVLEEANKLDIGLDVIVQKFVGPVYDVPGVATVLVEIATSVTAGGPPGAYQIINLVVIPTEVALPDSTRISVIEV